MQIVMRTPFILLLNQAAEHSAQSTLEIYSLFLLGSYHSLGTILRKYYLFKVIIKYQRPWKTSVFPDEIITQNKTLSSKFLKKYFNIDVHKFSHPHLPSHFLSKSIKGISDLSYSLDLKQCQTPHFKLSFFVNKGVVNYKHTVALNDR